MIGPETWRSIVKCSKEQIEMLCARAQRQLDLLEHLLQQEDERENKNMSWSELYQ